MSVTNDLYELWQKASRLETYHARERTEAETAIRERDELLALCRKWEVPTPDATCRNCDAPMSMRKWSEQYCHCCRGDDC